MENSEAADDSPASKDGSGAKHGCWWLRSEAPNKESKNHSCRTPVLLIDHAILRPRCSTVWESSWSCLHRGPMSKSNHQKKPATVLPRKRLATHWLACLMGEYIYILTGIPFPIPQEIPNGFKWLVEWNPYAHVFWLGMLEGQWEQTFPPKTNPKWLRTRSPRKRLRKKVTEDQDDQVCEFVPGLKLPGFTIWLKLVEPNLVPNWIQFHGMAMRF